MSINNQAVFAAFDQYLADEEKFKEQMNGATRILRESLIKLGVSTAEDAEPLVTAWAANKHGCPLIEGKGKAKGRMVLDSDAPTYEAARKAKQRMMKALTGDADKAKSPKSETDAAEAAEEFAVPAEIAAAAAALVALVNEYDLKAGELKKLAARAVAEAFAAAQ